MRNNETPHFCRDCGKCCASYPGGWLPSEISIERQKTLLESHLAVWDYYTIYNDEECRDRYYLRPANVKEHRKRKNFADSWPSGACIFLSSSGCKLSWEERPWECKDLKATGPGECSGTKDLKGMMNKDWISREWEAARRKP